MDTLLTLPEVADRLRVSEDTLRHWRYVGTGPISIKIGRHVRYRPEDVSAWVDAQAESPQPAACAGRVRPAS
jgi:excisionase family DNA binding protein